MRHQIVKNDACSVKMANFHKFSKKVLPKPNNSVILIVAFKIDSGANRHERRVSSDT